MADSRIDGAVRICLVPSIADPTAPTLAELAAGIDVECLMTGDGLAKQVTTNKIKTRKLCSRINSYINGSIDFGDTSLTLIKQLPLPDTIFDPLVLGWEGFMVERWDVDSDTAYAAGNEVIVMGIEIGEFNNATPEEDSLHTYMLPFTPTGVYESRAVVAA